MKLFLCVPFSGHVTESGAVEEAYRQTIERLLNNLRQHGHDVYCALEYADWTMGGASTPEEELSHDFAEIDRCDKVVVLVEERVSAGVQLENGYAFAKSKEVAVYQIGKPAWTNIAFAKLNGHEIVQVTDIDDFARQALIQN